MASQVPFRSARGLATVAVLAILAGGCSVASSPGPTAGGSPGPGESPVPSASPGPATSPTSSGSAAGTTLILRVTTEGGFVGPTANLAALPEVSVYADGRILTPGPVDSIDPPPLLPSVTVRDVGAAGEARIVAAIRAAGLDRPAASGTGGGIAGDTGTTVFAVDLDGTPVTSRLVLGGGGPPGRPGLGSPDPGVTAAADLLARLEDPNEAWGASSATTSSLQPTAYRLYVAPGAPSGDGSTAAPALAWPLATPLGAFGVPAVPDRGIAGLRQGSVLGADAATLGPILATATSQTAFSSGGTLYTLYVRPLLPDEVPAAG